LKLREPSPTIETIKEPVIVLGSADKLSKPAQSAPKSKIESKLEKEVHIVERYYSYLITSANCGNVFNDKLTQCPKCGGVKTT
jgi:hypothetical protein